MTEEEKKTISSQPPPPTDEIDGEWGDEDETLVRRAPSLSDPPKVSVKPSSTPPAAPSSEKPSGAADPSNTAAAPLSEARASTPEPAADEDEADEEDEEEDEDSDEGHEEEDDDEQEASAQPAHTSPAPTQDWIPEWGPFAVLALLVTLSILIGLGLIGGGEAKAGEEVNADAPAAATTAAKQVKPNGHP